MTLCYVDGKPCSCQPQEGVACRSLAPAIAIAQSLLKTPPEGLGEDVKVLAKTMVQLCETIPLMKPSDPDLDLGVLYLSYDWTLDAEGQLMGLIAGDMGYEATGLRLDEDTIKIWKLGVERNAEVFKKVDFSSYPGNVDDIVEVQLFCGTRAVKYAKQVEWVDGFSNSVEYYRVVERK